MAQQSKPSACFGSSLTRRALLAGLAATGAAAAGTTAAAAGAAYGYPIGNPGQPLGAGFFIRDGFTCENTWYLPGYWHTGEDWYRQEGNTAGAQVCAVAAGQVVYADANYPGRVVIVRHDDGLYAMYGHLDPALAVGVGARVARGDAIGRVFQRDDGVPSHLHFEIRTFLTTPAVNGSAPRYGFACGVNCPPGPGYWPIAAPDRPSDLGWRSPTHVIAHRMLARASSATRGDVVVAQRPHAATAVVRAAPESAAATVAELPLKPGTRYPLLAISAGPEASRGTSALAYDLWYRVRLADGRAGWVQAALPSPFDTGSDGRPSSVVFDLLPDAMAA